MHSRSARDYQLEIDFSRVPEILNLRKKKILASRDINIGAFKARSIVRYPAIMVFILIF